jgi:hypothetical protein
MVMSGIFARAPPPGPPPNPPIPDPALAAGNWPAMLPEWGQVAPFIMQFRLPNPSALASTEYARDYEEVKRMGGKNSTARTVEQSEIARTRALRRAGVASWRGRSA